MMVGGREGTGHTNQAYYEIQHDNGNALILWKNPRILNLFLEPLTNITIVLYSN